MRLTREVYLTLVMLAGLPEPLLAQGGWVPTINEGFVGHQRVVRHATTPVGRHSVVPRPTEGAHPVRNRATLILQEPSMVLAQQPPDARLGVPRAGDGQVSIVPAAPNVHRHTPLPAIPYLYGVHVIDRAHPVVDAVARRSDSSADLATAIVIGMPRAEVIRALGQPSATVYRASGPETLFFNSATITIQNGVVAVIQ